MSILRKIKDTLSSTSQRALGIDGIRFNLQAALERLERIYEIESKLAELQSRSVSIEARSASIEANSASTSNQIQNLKTFLAWYSNRVEPWFWTGNFSQTDPEEELAGLLFNFLPNRVLVNVGPHTHKFAQAASEVGYQVLSLEPPNALTSLPIEKRSPGTIDFLNIAGEQVDPELI